MSLSANQTALIEQLENADLINGRYEKLNCVNVQGDKRRGVLSLVFQGNDILQESLVAIKVMDPDRLSDAYRIRAFEREPVVLESLEGKNRCLQLKDGLQYYSWEVNLPNTPDPLKFRCGFFVMEWLEEDVDEYFLQQQDYDASEKLTMFRQLLLAVEAIHRWNIFHRDIKVDNIRIKASHGQPQLVLIDFGTAAHLSNPSLKSDYTTPVGAHAFSPPEAFLGFSGDRAFGGLSDSYALGVLLFSLFNYREFRYARDRETNFNNLISAMGPDIAATRSRKHKLNVWRNHLHRFKSLTSPPAIDGPGTTLPPAISQLIIDSYLQLVNFDFHHRTSDLSIIRKKIDTAIRMLNHQRNEAIEFKRRRIFRERKQEKIRLRQERLETYTAIRLPNYA